MGTTAGQALGLASEKASLFSIRHQLNLSSGQDALLLRANYELPDAVRAQAFSIVTAWTQQFNNANPDVQATCVRVNDEIQVNSAVGQRFPSAAMQSLNHAVMAAAPTSPGPGDDADAIGKQAKADPDDDEEEKPSDDDPQPLSV